MAFHVKTDLVEQLRRSRWFARQDPALQQALAEGGRKFALAKGQWLHSEGDQPSGIWAVLSGSVRLEVSVGAHRDLLLSIVGPGTMAGGSERLGGGPRLLTVRAAEPSTMFLIGDGALQSISNRHPMLWRAVNEMLYGQLERAIGFAAESLCLPPRMRVAARLLELIGTGDRSSTVAVVSQADLAEMTGLSRKSVNGHLAHLEALGLVTLARSRIEIVSRDRLVAFTQGRKSQTLEGGM